MEAACALGARTTESGVAFAVCSSTAERLELCLFDSVAAAVERERIAMSRHGDVWHAHVEHLRPGAVYGYRAHGEYAPERGLRHNANKLLLDPYARAVVGRATWHPLHQGGTSPDDRDAHPGDSAAVAPRGLVVDETFDWGDDRRPEHAWSDTVLYECHVKGMTAGHPDVPAELRGSFLGLCCPPVIEHLKRLGVTALSLMPVHQSYDERALVERGQSNYWGYATLGFFAPAARFASRKERGGEPGRHVAELKTMVKVLHAAGLEVLIDVVYNHTAESDHLGPTVSLRGLDNAAYYRLRPDALERYIDDTGCGNTLALENARCRALVLDSMRYFAQEMHVDGFRFDLAPALCRPAPSPGESAFVSELLADPVLSRLKLVAEPWDLGPGGYQLGRFPSPFREWNDRCRDAVRRFFRGDGGAHADLATRLAGSSDVFETAQRPATSSINFVACHDGFTLWDSQSYLRKHNEDNGEGNRDGRQDNLSQNFGHEGPSDEPAVLKQRLRAARSMLTVLCCSTGVPMLSHGDELLRTQRGNNNAYCQDSELTWLAWGTSRDLRDFLGAALALRRRHPLLRRERFLHGAPVKPRGVDLSWHHPDGRPMAKADWRDSQQCALGMMLHPGPEGALAPSIGALLLLCNGTGDEIRFHLPTVAEGDACWVVVLDADALDLGPRAVVDPSLSIPARCAVVLELSVSSSDPRRA